MYMNIWVLLVIGIVLLGGYYLFVGDFSIHDYAPSASESYRVYEPIVASGKLIFDFIDVGQGDSIYIEFPNGKNMLVDCGKYGQALSFLESHNITWLDYMVTTHADFDHIGGCDDIAEEVHIDNYYDNGIEGDSKTYNSLRNAIGGVYRGELRAYDKLDIDEDVLIAVLNPPDNFGTDQNENSVVLKMYYGTSSILLTGDCESECENFILENERNLVQSGLLKVAHHGSNSSSSDEFLEAVSPQISIISVGMGNPYDHPSKDVLERLSYANSSIYRTDLDGNIRVTVEGDGTYMVVKNIFAPKI